MLISARPQGGSRDLSGRSQGHQRRGQLRTQYMIAKLASKHVPAGQICDGSEEGLHPNQGARTCRGDATPRFAGAHPEQRTALWPAVRCSHTEHGRRAHA